jgi:hypothetical protein
LPASLLAMTSSVQKFDGLSLQPFLALADFHPHPLAFSQTAQPGACKCRHMDEDILSPTVLTDKTEAFVGLVQFNGANTFAGRAYDLRNRCRASLRGGGRTRIICPNFGCSVVKRLIVAITAALRPTVVVFVTAHSMLARLQQQRISRFLRGPSQEGSRPSADAAGGPIPAFASHFGGLVCECWRQSARGALDLTFAARVRGRADSECQIRSTSEGA